MISVVLLAVNEPSVVAAFGAGIISFVSPCVLPLVPGYLALLSGLSVHELRDGEVRPVRVLGPALLFVAGFTLVFVVLGATAVSLFQVFNNHQRGLNQIAGVLVILMGLFLAGLVTPRFLLVERRLHLTSADTGIVAAPLMGMAFAFGWTPCIGPILGGVLTLADNQATVGQGIGLLLAYSLGLGVPFLATGLAFDRLTGVFDWIKRHYRALHLLSGGVLVAFGVLLVLNRVTWLSSELIDVMDDLGLDFLTQI